jgi:hypothetical protein
MTNAANGIAPARSFLWAELAVLAVVAAAVRLVGASGSLWLDELFTAWVVLGTDGTMAERAAAGNAAAPYYWLVRASVACFGTSELAIRLPSLAFGTAVPVVAYFLGRAVTGSVWGGRVAGLLVALDGFCCAYAAEARPYSVLQFFGALQLLAFWNLLSGASWRWRVAFVTTTIAVGYFHFAGLAIIGGEVAYYVLLRMRGERLAYTLTQFVLDLAIAGVALLPLVPLVLAIAGRKANFDISAKAVGLEDLVILHRQPAYVILPAVAAAFVCFARPKSEPRRAWVVPLAFLVVIFYATAVPIWAAHRVGGPSLFRVRYTLILYLLPLVTAGLGAVAWPSRYACIVFALAAIVLGQLVESPARRIAAGGSPRLTHDNWRGAVEYVKEKSAPTAPVFVRAGLIETDGYLANEGPMTHVYLTLPVRTVYPLTANDRVVRSLAFNGDFASDADVETFRRAGKAWFLVQGEPAFADQVVARVTARLAKSGVPVTVTDREAKRNVTAFRVVRAP